MYINTEKQAGAMQLMDNDVTPSFYPTPHSGINGSEIYPGYPDAADRPARMKQLAEGLIRSGEMLYTGGSVSDGLRYFEKALKRVNTLEDRIGRKEFLKMRIRLYRYLIEIYSLVSGINELSSHVTDPLPINPLQVKINVLQANYYQDLAKLSSEL